MTSSSPPPDYSIKDPTISPPTRPSPPTSILPSAPPATSPLSARLEALGGSPAAAAATVDHPLAAAAACAAGSRDRSPSLHTAQSSPANRYPALQQQPVYHTGMGMYPQGMMQMQPMVVPVMMQQPAAAAPAAAPVNIVVNNTAEGGMGGDKKKSKKERAKDRRTMCPDCQLKSMSVMRHKVLKIIILVLAFVIFPFGLLFLPFLCCIWQRKCMICRKARGLPTFKCLVK